MMKIRLYGIMLLLWAGMIACVDNDNVKYVDSVNLIDFEFPQGNDPWDKEIEQIAKDWGMYIIYKDVDSTHLNKMWTTPSYNSPIYTCTTPSGEEVQQYVELVKEWLLGSLDKDVKEDRDLLPCYLYVVNDFKDNNPKSPTYGKHIQLKQDGLDYWSLSFTSEEMEAGLTPKMIHTLACAFSYLGMKSRFETGEYKVASEFVEMSDYEEKIGIRYYSLEDFLADNSWASEMDYQFMVTPYEKDPENAFLRRGFLPQVGENFELITVVTGDMGPKETYGAPTWMPWIPYADYGDFVIDDNPGPVAETVEERVLLDFLNTIRYAIVFSEQKVREKFPLDAEDPLDVEGNQIINAKYDLVVEYMKTTYGIDLPKYASILDE